MALDLDFSVRVSECCNKIKICDCTGDYDPENPTDSACNGYGMTDAGERTDEVIRSQVVSTAFNVISPSGTVFTNKNLGLVIAQYASVSMDITDGAAGDWLIVTIADIYLGQAIYISDSTDLVVNLVKSINLNSSVTGWRAYYSSSTVYIYNTDSGTEFNGQTLAVYTNTSTALTIDISESQTSGGNDLDDCVFVTVADLYGWANCPSSCWTDGVWTFVYIILNESGTEIARKNKKFLFDCNVKKCICNHLKRLTDDNCGCHDDVKVKVSLLTQTLEAIGNEFDCGLYDSANEHIQDLSEQCSELCLDC